MAGGIEGDGTSARKSRRRWMITIGLAALALGLVGLAGPASDTLLGAPCLNCPGQDPGTTYYKLTVNVAGPGTVAESPLSCTEAESPCSWFYAELDSAHPVPTPDSGYSFTGWSGACSGTGSCSITMNANKSVTASFADTTAPPSPTISSPTAGQTFVSTSSGSPNVLVSFVRADGGGATGTSGFRCRLDNSTPVGCTSPWPTGLLATGQHTVYVAAFDPAGNLSGYTSRSFWAVNRPDTSIGGTPAQGALVNSRSTAFTYSSGTNGATFDCELDGNPVVCSANLEPGEGPHTLSVRAGVDPGNGSTYLDETPATRSWTVDSQPPETSIDSGPSQQTSATSAEFAFSGVDPAPGTALHYECSLDGRVFEACTSPMSVAGLSASGHTFSVRAVDAAGNADPTPASRSWTLGSGSGGGSTGGGATGGGATGGGAVGAGPAGAPSPMPLAVAPGKLARVKWRAHGSRIELRALTLTGLAPGSGVLVTCMGHGCPIKHRKALVRRGKAQLAGALRHRALRPGTRIELQITAPQMTTRIIRVTIRAHRKPKVSGG